jgi:hypothetical protein
LFDVVVDEGSIPSESTKILNGSISGDISPDMVATISLACAQCGVEFQKARNEYNRQTKKGKDKFFCTQSCSTTFFNKVKVERLKTQGKDPFEQAKKNIEPFYGRGYRDELTPYRWFILRAKARGKRFSRKSCEVTPEYLKDLFDRQDGKCPLTGWDMVLPESTSGWKSGNKPENASLDRVDNDKGYIEGNVRFVALIANMARQAYTDKQVIEFCKAVVNNNGIL